MNQALLALLGARAAGAASGVLEYLPGSYTGASAASVTISGVDIGAASATRTVVVVVSAGGGLNRDCTSMTIGGVSATRDASSGMARASCHIFRASVPTGTSVDVVTQWSSVAKVFFLYVYVAPTALTLDGTLRVDSDGITNVLSGSIPTHSTGTVVATAEGPQLNATSWTVDAGNAGREPGTGSDVTLTVTFDSAPTSEYARLVAASYH